MLGELIPTDGGNPILLAKPSLTLGRSRECDIVITDQSVEPSHCRLDFRDGRWFVEDLSDTGICVEGVRTHSTWVPVFGILGIGDVQFEMHYRSGGTETDVSSPAVLQPTSVLRSQGNGARADQPKRVRVEIDRPLPANAPERRLGFLAPTDGGLPLPLFYEQLYVGSDADCDVVLPFMTVAPTHCVLQLKNGYWYVRDLNENGVNLNGTAVNDGWLLPGTLLAVGNREFKIDYKPPQGVPPPVQLVTSDDEEDAPLMELESPTVEDMMPAQTYEEEPQTEHETPMRSGAGTSTADLWLLSSDDDPSIDLPVTLTKPRQPCDETLTSVATTEPTAELPIQEKRTPADRQPPVIATPAARSTGAPAPIAAQIAHTDVVRPAEAVTARTVTDEFQTSEAETQARESRVPAAPKAAHWKAGAPAGESQIAVPARIACIDERHDRIGQLLADRGCGALLLTRPSSVSWFTAGGEPPCDGGGDVTTAILITPNSRLVLSPDPEADLLIHRQIPGLGFQVRKCIWQEGLDQAMGDLTPGVRIACDQPLEPLVDVSSDLSPMRLPLSAHELRNLRTLGRLVTHAVEATSRQLRRGETEAEVAGQLAHRLIRHEVTPERIQVWADGHGRQYRHWTYGTHAVDQFCTISVIARRRGLHVAMARTVCFGNLTKELRWMYPDCLLPQATGMFFAKEQWELKESWKRVARIHEKLGSTDEWQRAERSCVTGYELCEAPVASHSKLHLTAGMPMIWRTSIGVAMSADTILIGESGFEPITHLDHWPQLNVKVKGLPIPQPAVLVRSE